MARRWPRRRRSPGSRAAPHGLPPSAGNRTRRRHPVTRGRRQPSRRSGRTPGRQRLGDRSPQGCARPRRRWRPPRRGWRGERSTSAFRRPPGRVRDGSPAIRQAVGGSLAPRVRRRDSRQRGSPTAVPDLRATRRSGDRRTSGRSRPSPGGLADQAKISSTGRVVGIRAGCSSTLGRRGEVHALEEGLEAGVGAEGVERRPCFENHQPPASRLQSSGETSE